MTAPRAAGLPVGSVAAYPHTAWIKVDLEGFGTWFETNNDFPVYDGDVQQALDGGAQVLRVGDGSDQ